jgi:amino acid permease
MHKAQWGKCNFFYTLNSALLLWAWWGWSVRGTHKRFTRKIVQMHQGTSSSSLPSPFHPLILACSVCMCMCVCVRRTSRWLWERATDARIDNNLQMHLAIVSWFSLQDSLLLPSPSSLVVGEITLEQIKLELIPNWINGHYRLSGHHQCR